MSLQEKIRQFDKRKKESAIDWQKQKEEWIKSVDSLFLEIQNWYRDLSDEGLIIFHEDTIELNEENIGKYSINKMRIEIHDQTIELKPVGTLLIGAWGRIDIRKLASIDNPKMLIRVKDQKDELHWEIIKKGTNEKIGDFNKVNFDSIIEEWIM